MTTELTPCPDCGRPSNNGRTCRLCDSEDALHKALTQRPAAQPAGHDCVYRAEPLHPGDMNGPQTAACMTCGQPPRVLGTPPQATPEPVREAIIGRWLYEKWWAEYGKLADVDKPYYTFDELPEKQRAAYESLALMLTHPAPGVPESPRQLRKRFEQHMRDVFACKDTAFLSIDGGKTYLDGSMDNHWRTWLAAQANGGE